MSNTLEEIIVYIVNNYPRRLNRTELVKMVFLFEYYHMQTFSCQYSDVTFVRYDHGPYSAQIIDLANQLYQSDLLTCNKYSHTSGGYWYQYGPGIKIDTFVSDMDEERCAIADYAIKKTRELNFVYNYEENYNPLCPVVPVAPLSHRTDLKRPFDLPVFAQNDSVKLDSLVQLKLTQPVLKVDLGDCMGCLSTEKIEEMIAMQLMMLGIE